MTARRRDAERRATGRNSPLGRAGSSPLVKVRWKPPGRRVPRATTQDAYYGRGNRTSFRARRGGSPTRVSQRSCRGARVTWIANCNGSLGGSIMAGASEEWQRAHNNGWVATVFIDTEGTYHSRADNTAIEEAVATWDDRAPDLSSAQEAADQLVPTHNCTCPAWTEVTAKVLLQVKCAAEHDISATFTPKELRHRLSTGTLTFYCERCDARRSATAEEQQTVLRRLEGDTT